MNVNEEEHIKIYSLNINVIINSAPTTIYRYIFESEDYDVEDYLLDQIEDD